MKWHCAVGEAGGGAGDAGEEMQCWVGSDGGARTGRMPLTSHEGQRHLVAVSRPHRRRVWLWRREP